MTQDGLLRLNELATVERREIHSPGHVTLKCVGASHEGLTLLQDTGLLDENFTAGGSTSFNSYILFRTMS